MHIIGCLGSAYIKTIQKPTVTYVYIYIIFMARKDNLQDHETGVSMRRGIELACRFKLWRLHQNCWQGNTRSPWPSWACAMSEYSTACFGWMNNIQFFSTNHSWTKTIQSPGVQSQFQLSHRHWPMSLHISPSTCPASRTMVSLTWPKQENLRVNPVLQMLWSLCLECRTCNTSKEQQSMTVPPEGPGGSGFSRKGNLPSMPWRRVRTVGNFLAMKSQSLLSKQPLCERQCGCVRSTCRLQSLVT